MTELRRNLISVQLSFKAAGVKVSDILDSLCSPKDTRPTFDKYNTYMQYISSGRFIPDSSNGRQSNLVNRPKASTPTPRRLSVTLL